MLRIVTVLGWVGPRACSYIDGEGAFIVGTGRCVGSLRLEQHSQVVEAQGGVGMGGAEGLLANGEGALKEGAGLGVGPCAESR